MFFSQKNSMLGVDIGSSAIKIVQLQRGDQPVLETYGMVDIPSTITSQTTEEDIKKIEPKPEK